MYEKVLDVTTKKKKTAWLGRTTTPFAYIERYYMLTYIHLYMYPRTETHGAKKDAPIFQSLASTSGMMTDRQQTTRYKTKTRFRFRVHLGQKLFGLCLNLPGSIPINPTIQ